jgi:hypothetical protein
MQCIKAATFRYIKKNLIRMKLSKEQILGIVRHALTFTGGIIVMKGLADDGLVAEVIGGIMTLVGAVWSIVDKKAA